MVGVGEERDGKFLFQDEFFVAFSAVLTDAVHFYAKFGEPGQEFGEFFCFECAAGGVVFWVEVEYGEVCGCVREADFVAGCIGETDAGDGVVYV